MNIDFKNKLGNFPVWVWGVFVAIAGLGIYFVYSRRSNNANDVSTTTLSGSGYQTAGINDSTRGNNNSIVSTDNNQSWLSRASKAVADLTQASPTSVYAALQKWLTGQDISTQEKSWVDRALQTVGNPPESIQGTSNVLPDPTTANKSLSSLTRDIASINGAVYAHWSDGSTSWVSAAQLAQLQASKPVTDVLSNGNPVVKWIRDPSSPNRTVYAADAQGNKQWVSAAAYQRAGSPATVAA